MAEYFPRILGNLVHAHDKDKWEYKFHEKIHLCIGNFDALVLPLRESGLSGIVFGYEFAVRSRFEVVF